MTNNSPNPLSAADFVARIIAGVQVQFSETMQVIAENYHYHPAAFSNGLGNSVLKNPAGSNEGSCKIFAFARLQQLNEQQTLQLFGDYYRLDVQQNPQGSDHQNIRNFIKFGWPGIHISDNVLTEKTL